MPAKCDKQLDWWIRLANLHRQDVPKVADPLAGNSGFSGKVEKLRGPRPEGVQVLLNKSGSLRDLLIGAGSDPDRYLWGLALVADTVLSKISELGQAQQFPKEVIIVEPTVFPAPLILSVSTSGEVAKAYRPEPLDNDLLSIIRGRNTNIVGTCPICEKLFQRLRSDQKCDSRRCRDTHRQRLYRAEQPVYEANRRRYRKEGIKAKELISFSAGLRRSSKSPSEPESLAPGAFSDLSPKK